MKLLHFAALLFAFAAILFAGWGVAEHRQLAGATFDHQRLQLLQVENDRLRTAVDAQEKNKRAAAELAQRTAIEKAVTEIRGLQFLHPVDYAVLTRTEIKQTLQNKLAEQFSDADFKNVTTGLVALGLLPPGYPLKQKYIDLLGEQVAAFYDQH